MVVRVAGDLATRRDDAGGVARAQLEQMRALPPGSLQGHPGQMGQPGAPVEEGQEQGSQGGMYL